MFDWIEKLISWIKTETLPFFSIPEYQRGVLLRFGKALRNKDGTYKILQPGFHWCIPFADDVLTVSVVTTTLDLSDQTVTTANGVQIVVEGTVKYEVADAGKLLLDVSSPQGALADMSKGIIRTTLAAANWPDCNGQDFDKLLNRKVKKEAEQWGLKVHSLNIVSMAPMRSIRLLNTQSYKNQYDNN